MIHLVIKYLTLNVSNVPDKVTPEKFRGRILLIKCIFFLNERKKAKIKIIKKWYHMAGYACIIGDAYSVDAKRCVLLEII